MFPVDPPHFPIAHHYDIKDDNAAAVRRSKASPLPHSSQVAQFSSSVLSLTLNSVFVFRQIPT
jgi:hypothetical protein